MYRIVSGGGKILEDPTVPSFKSGMPAFGEQLSHEELIAVITYVKSLWGDQVKSRSDFTGVAGVSQREPTHFRPDGN